MDFTFDDQQLAFRDAIRKFLMVEAAPEMLREIWETQSGRSADLRAKLADQGLTGAVGARGVQGGIGLGRSRLGTDPAGTGLLRHPGFAVRHRLPREPTCSIINPTRNSGKSGCQRSRRATRVSPSGIPFNPLVADAQAADLLLLVAQRRNARTQARRHPADFQPEHRHVAPAVQGRVDAFATKPALRLHRSEGRFGRGALNRAALAAAAQLLGLAQRMLDLGIDYAAQRKQFGKPIGSFQAVKHHLADVAVKIEFARPVVARAAYALAHDAAQQAVHVSHAKLAAGEAATLAARQSLQVHGAMGYTWEADLQMFMKRAWALDAAWGDRAFHKSRVAAFVLARRRRRWGPALLLIRRYYRG